LNKRFQSTIDENGFGGLVLATQFNPEFLVRVNGSQQNNDPVVVQPSPSSTSTG
jgi:hypothetical protein